MYSCNVLLTQVNKVLLSTTPISSFIRSLTHVQSATTQAQHCPAQETVLQYVQDSLCNEAGYCEAARSVLQRVTWSSQLGNGLHVCMWRCTHTVFICILTANILKKLRCGSQNTTQQVLYRWRELPDSNTFDLSVSQRHTPLHEVSLLYLYDDGIPQLSPA